MGMGMGMGLCLEACLDDDLVRWGDDEREKGNRLDYVRKQRVILDLLVRGSKERASAWILDGGTG